MAFWLIGGLCYKRCPPPPLQTATVADGTHPARMHSCKIFFQSAVIKIILISVLFVLDR